MSDELRRITETSDQALVRWQKRALSAESKAVELEKLVGWAQHHVNRAAPKCNEFLGRTFEILGKVRATSFDWRAIESKRGES